MLARPPGTCALSCVRSASQAGSPLELRGPHTAQPHTLILAVEAEAVSKETAGFALRRCIETLVEPFSALLPHLRIRERNGALTEASAWRRIGRVSRGTAEQRHHRARPRDKPQQGQAKPIHGVQLGRAPPPAQRRSPHMDGVRALVDTARNDGAARLACGPGLCRAMTGGGPE